MKRVLRLTSKTISMIQKQVSQPKPTLMTCRPADPLRVNDANVVPYWTTISMKETVYWIFWKVAGEQYPGAVFVKMANHFEMSLAQQTVINIVSHVIPATLDCHGLTIKPHSAIQGVFLECRFLETKFRSWVKKGIQNVSWSTLISRSKNALSGHY